MGCCDTDHAQLEEKLVGPLAEAGYHLATDWHGDRGHQVWDRAHVAGGRVGEAVVLLQEFAEVWIEGVKSGVADEIED